MADVADAPATGGEEVASVAEAQEDSVIEGDDRTETTLTSVPPGPPPTVLSNAETLPEASSVTLPPVVPGGAEPPAPLQSPGTAPAALPGPGATAPVAQPPAKEDAAPALPPIPQPHSFVGHSPPRAKMGGGGNVPLSLNQLAIVAASQNKLPTSRVKGIVMRMGRHTASSAGKLGRWYKGDHYIDPANYSWRNMELFIDYQKQMYTPAGTIKASCKK